MGVRKHEELFSHRNGYCECDTPKELSEITEELVKKFCDGVRAKTEDGIKEARPARRH